MWLKPSGYFYLANMWNSLRTSFNLPLPSVAITCGWPSRRSRGRSANRIPGEIVVAEWKGSNIEKAFVSIHPERFKDVEQVALATLYVVGNEVYGSRRNLGSLTLGVVKNAESGVLEYSLDEKGHHAQTTLSTVIKQLGTLPQGFAELPEPKAPTANRQRKYACNVCGAIIRAGSTDLQAIHAADNGTFVLQVPAVQAAAATAEAPVAPAPERRQGQGKVSALAAAAQPATPTPALTPQQENIVNVSRAVRAGAARVVHGRNFGAEPAAVA